MLLNNWIILSATVFRNVDILIVMSKEMNRLLRRLPKTSIKLARPSQQDQTGSVGIFNTYFVSLNCTIKKNFAPCIIFKKIMRLLCIFSNVNFKIVAILSKVKIIFLLLNSKKCDYHLFLNYFQWYKLIQMQSCWLLILFFLFLLFWSDPPPAINVINKLVAPWFFFREMGYTKLSLMIQNKY